MFKAISGHYFQTKKSGREWCWMLHFLLMTGPLRSVHILYSTLRSGLSISLPRELDMNCCVNAGSIFSYSSCVYSNRAQQLDRLDPVQGNAISPSIRLR